MLPLVYGEIYKPPSNYHQPDDANLAENTFYPNLNSRDYSSRPLNHTLRMFRAWECITLNENQAIIATNKLSGREWTSSLFGFNDIDGPLKVQTAQFKLQCGGTITSIKYVQTKIFISAQRSGKVQVWSTHSEMSNTENPYSLYLIREKTEHEAPILCMDTLKANTNQAISGSSDGMLKVWDMGTADLYSIQTFRFAHTDAITGLDSSHKDSAIFATCSLDKTAFLWDIRLTRPAISIYDGHAVRFKAIVWASQTTSSTDNYIYLGDESGYVHSLDKRLPNQFINSFQHFDRPIRKILPNSSNLAIISDSNCVKVVDSIADQAVIYENSESQNFVRDGVWRADDEFLTVGFEGKLRKHKLCNIKANNHGLNSVELSTNDKT